MIFKYFSDAGFYECQVSTSPPTGQQVKLSVVGTNMQSLQLQLNNYI